MRRLPSRPKGRQAYVYTPPPTLLQQHKRGAAYVITLPPSTPAPVRPPPAPPGRCPEPASATTRPQRSRAADNGHRRAAPKLRAAAGASLRAPPPKHGGQGGEGGDSLDSGTPLERSNDSDDARTLSSGGCGCGCERGCGYGCGCGCGRMRGCGCGRERGRGCECR